MKLFILLISLLFLLLNPLQVRANEYDEYQRDVDLYRTAYSQYEVKLGEFNLYKTFAAEEDLVKAASTMLLTRADVWISYWELIKIRITNLSGMPADNKASWEQKLTTEISWLKEHKQFVVDGKTRSNLMALAKELNDKNETYGTMAFSANADISITTLWQTSQSLLKFNEELSKRVSDQQLSAEAKDTKLRGLSVNKERIQALVSQLEMFRIKFSEASGYATAQSFARITQDISPIYSELSLLYQILQELSEDVEW